MTSINSSSLFHFTKKESWLKSILTNGMRFSYSFETFPEEAVANELSCPISAEETGVGIPMACFCDIPLLRTLKHRKRYGSYMIGLNKDLMIDFYSPIMNPVLYANSENLVNMLIDFSKLRSDLYLKTVDSIYSLQERLLKGFKEKGLNGIMEDESFINMVDSNFQTRFNINFLFGLIKPYSGQDNKGASVCFYDEREWRVFWVDGLSKESNWVWGINKEAFYKERNQWNKSLKESEEGYITFQPNMITKVITHIIVSKELEIKDMIKHIMHSKKIFGITNFSVEDRLLLVSKVSSFERIENDY